MGICMTHAMALKVEWYWVVDRQVIIIGAETGVADYDSDL